ncbi:MAG: hypothetical protein VX640_08110 [Pseudomonadota bacterium]|nr:hypothetical protein [Pseudomonadota bacterium]
MRKYRWRRASGRRAAMTAAVIAALISLMWSGAAVADPACADAALGFEADDMNAPRVVESFSLAGAEVFLTARGRTAYADTELARDFIEESQEMDKVMPGYPQPAYVTFSLSVSF